MNKICKGAHPSYRGKDICAYNMAKAFIETVSFLDDQVSDNKYKWKWGMLHTREWPNLPWSRTPLKFLFHRTASGSGNGNTPNFAKHSNRNKLEQVKFQTSMIAVYKYVTTLDPDADTELGFYSLDTGQNENPLQGNYFDMRSEMSLCKINIIFDRPLLLL